MKAVRKVNQQLLKEAHSLLVDVLAKLEDIYDDEVDLFEWLPPGELDIAQERTTAIEEAVDWLQQAQANIGAQLWEEQK